MLVVVQLVFQAIFIFCVCYAIVSDFRQLLIPNWIPLLLVGAFAVLAPFKLDIWDILQHLALAGVVLLVATGFFAANWIAGGDVKLLTALMLWMGPEYAAPFALLTAIFGFVLALVLVGLKRYGFYLQHHLPANRLLDRLTALAGSNQVPYGVAIGTSALLTTNQIFWA